VDLDRRTLLAGAAAAGSLAVVGGAGLGARGLAAGGLGQDRVLDDPAALPSPDGSGIEHVVVVMMENRSFDHFLGWLPGADGKQAGLSFVDRYGVRHRTHHLRHFASCGHADPDHSYEGGRIELDGGRDDGWLRAGENDALAIGYYKAADLDFFRVAAPAWTTCDRYFAGVLAETYPNRFYQHAARTDRLHNSTDQATIPTIWDRLSAAGLTGKYYFSDIPFTALWYTKYLGISHPFAEFLADAAAGTLPAVSFVDPRFEDEASGTSSDDHPTADVRAGEQFLAQVYDAVTSSPAWANTVLVVNYDEWGGFYDHVTPGLAPDAHRRTRRRGFRVPALVISPLAKRHHVAHRTYDHTSVLKLIEWRWGLDPLTPRDAAARNLAEVLDWESPPDLSAPAITVPPFVSEAPCSGATGPASPEAEWKDLRRLALRLGWTLPS
jgi:phospholipase C